MVTNILELMYVCHHTYNITTNNYYNIIFLNKDNNIIFVLY
ncbi:hypothetical protein EST35_0013 [Pseudomonas phage vB_PaeM_PA5oct]|uniref:Uncharacterized protein n=1 Tax=Pseudomonas phage vB_PaeM_PA5oct TaxID=2163605 RepID=A0A4Y5JT11_9CAUD|nr:hypothetical protein PQE65_gp013 [Pseudomonas phage vB_PaeM_PA5oct]QCG75897.1 hypothetical protein EST35_0013 [Pseudomonas phage vB_PaeM_PA5oct]